MRELLTEEMKVRLPKLFEQEGSKDPMVYAKFSFPAGGWVWFVTEGQTTEGDFTFFGYVIGYEAEWGYFMLGELEQVKISGFVIERDNDFQPQTLNMCLSGLTGVKLEKVAAGKVLDMNPESV